MENMENINQLANGVENININQQPLISRKKRPARAYHNVQSPSVPLAANGFSQPPQINPQAGVNGFQSPQLSSPDPSAQFSANSPAFPQQMQFNYEQQQQQQSFGGGFSSPDSLSVPSMRKKQEDLFFTEPFKTYQNTVPPTSTTNFIAVDQGTASPKHMRSSMYQIPISENLRNATKLPLGLTIRPFAPLTEFDQPIPEVDLTGVGGPLRCRRCRTYLNPEMKFTMDQRFICNMCKFPTPVPVEYVSPIDSTGKRMDYLQRPELHRGVVDYIVPESYWVKEKFEPKTLHHLFVIDVSAPTDIVRSVTQSIRAVLNDIPEFVKVGIITFDEKIQFYNLEAEQTTVNIISDLSDPFLPFNKGLFVNPRENIFQINDALNKIDELYDNYKPGEIIFGSVLEYINLIFESIGGGKVTTILSKIPSKGLGSLISSINNKKYGVDVFKNDNIHYNKMSDKFIANNIGIDLFIFTSNEVDLINLGQVVFNTGGLLKIYQNFNVNSDEIAFNEEFKLSVLNTKGYQGQLKVRCSSGLQVEQYYGNFLQNGSIEPKLPILNQDQEFSVLFKYDSKLNKKDDVHFQAALLYTGIDGKRRVRVINLITVVSDDISSVFSFLDQDVILNIIIKDCLTHLSQQDSTEIKNSTTNKLIQILTQYRALVSPSTLLPTQLIVPDDLSSLIAYISSFQKSKVFKTSTNNNLKILDYYKLNSLTLDKLLLKLYPRIIPLHELPEDAGSINEINGFINLPETLRASSEFIQNGGAYLIFNGEMLYLWLHNNVNPLLIKDLFGYDSIEQLPVAILNQLPQLDSTISIQTNNLIKYFEKLSRYETITFKLIIGGTTGIENEIGEFLVEDRTIDKVISYQELLSYLHKSIKEKIEKQQVIKTHEVKHDDSTLTQRFIHF